jgi:hypothetical protein
MRWLLSSFRVAAASSARLAPIGLGLSVASFGSMRALGAEPDAPVQIEAASEPAVVDPRAPDGLLLVKQRLVSFQILQGRFEQEKRIAKIRRPLESRGRFVLVQGKGMLWRTEAPIQSLLTLTADALSVVQGDHRIVSRSLSGDSSLRVFGQGVVAAFMGDVSQIRQSFRLIAAHVPQRPAPWSLSLQPREAAVGKLMREIQLVGGEQIESIKISESNGDNTLIRLLDLDRQSPLAAEDARLLGRADGKP